MRAASGGLLGQDSCNTAKMAVSSNVFAHAALDINLAGVDVNELCPMTSIFFDVGSGLTPAMKLIMQVRIFNCIVHQELIG